MVQEKIVRALRRAERLGEIREEANQLTNKIIQSVFLKMFGNPITNPRGWPTESLGSIAGIVMGRSPRGSTYNKNGKGIPLLNGPAEFGDRFPTPVQWTNEPTTLARGNDILFCVRGATAGRMNFADRDYCIGRGLAAIRGDNTNSTTEFIREHLEFIQKQFREIRTTTFANVSKDQLERLELPAPPIELQRKFSSVFQNVYRTYERQAVSTQEIKEVFHSLMHKAFRGELAAAKIES
jgi:type I restriction enzyme S subunit